MVDVDPDVTDDLLSNISKIEFKFTFAYHYIKFGMPDKSEYLLVLFFKNIHFSAKFK